MLAPAGVAVNGANATSWLLGSLKIVTTISPIGCVCPIDSYTILCDSVQDEASLGCRNMELLGSFNICECFVQIVNKEILRRENGIASHKIIH